jgi:hypothetical protein
VSCFPAKYQKRQTDCPAQAHRPLQATDGTFEVASLSRADAPGQVSGLDFEQIDAPPMVMGIRLTHRSKGLGVHSSAFHPADQNQPGCVRYRLPPQERCLPSTS